MSRLAQCPGCAYERMSEAGAAWRCPECGRTLPRDAIAVAVRRPATTMLGSRRVLVVVGIYWLGLTVWWLLVLPWFVAANAALFMAVVGGWVWTRRGWGDSARAADAEGTAPDPIDAILVIDADGLTPWVDGRARRGVPWSALRAWSFAPWRRGWTNAEAGVVRRLHLRSERRRDRVHWILQVSDAESALIEAAMRRGASSAEPPRRRLPDEEPVDG